MALYVWFSEDITHALASARHGMRATAAARTDAPGPEERAWQAGFEAGLDTLAVAFGLAPASERVEGEVITLPQACYRVTGRG